MRRFIFAMAAPEKPVGGRNVILRSIDRLNEAGFTAHPLYPRADYTYAYHPCSAEAFFDQRLEEVFHPTKRRERWKSLSARAKIGVNTRYQPASDDVIVVPEFRFPEVAAAFPDKSKVCFIQDVYGFVYAYLRDLRRGRSQLDGFDALFATSEASARAVQVLANKAPTRLQLDIEVPDGTFEKENIVAYMPRKRPKEAETIVSLLRALPEFAVYRFVKIETMSPAELTEVFRRARIFLSFSWNEGFGLPPAEAMAFGCVAIGYTGVGGEEYFTIENGFPIPDGDIIQFVETARQVAHDFAADPATLDVKRAQARAFIKENYSAAKATEALVSGWRKLDETLTKKMTASTIEANFK